VAVSVDSGEARLIGPEDNIPLAAGIAASCAAPGIISPVRLDEGRYIDGGARSATNADLVAGFGVERCIVASPVVRSAPMVGEATHRVVEAEAEHLRAKGVHVTLLVPTDIEMDAFGYDLLSMDKVEAAIKAGRKRASVEAGELG
jgi:NTE family protein